MTACASDLSLKLRIGDDLPYDRAVINLTHTQSKIRAHAMSAVLANTISSQYSLQNDYHLATTLQHDDHINLIQSSRKRSRNFDRASLYQRQLERIRNEDPNPAPSMNQMVRMAQTDISLGITKFQYPTDILTLSLIDHATRNSNPHHPRLYAIPLTTTATITTTTTTTTTTPPFDIKILAKTTTQVTPRTMQPANTTTTTILK